METIEKSSNSKITQIELFGNMNSNIGEEDYSKKDIVQQELFEMLKEEIRLKRIKL